MNERNLLQDSTVLSFLRYLDSQSKDTIINISKLINRKRRERYPESEYYKLGDRSKKIELEKFNKIIKNEKNQKAKLCYKIMYFMGLRVSEVVEIKLNDIIDDQLTIRNIKARKRETRIIPIVIREDIKNYIERHYKEIKYKNNYLFYKVKKKEPISKDWIRNRFRKITTDLGINKVYGHTNHKDRRRLFLYSTHSLRHSFANRFYEKSGKDIEKTRIAMRHSLIKDTQNYIRGDLEEVAKIMEKI